MKLSTIPRFIGLFLLLSSPTHALVTYESDAFSTFTLLSPDGMTVTITTPPEPSSTTTTGTGAASVDADSQAGALPTFTMESDVSGSADDPFGTSAATVLNGLFVVLDNSLGTTPATAIFEFSYDWFAEVTRTDPAEEAGFASPFFHLSGFAPSGDETLMIDEGFGAGLVSVPDWLVNPVVELPFGGIAMGIATVSAGPVTVTAYVTVPTGGVDSFSVLTDSSGGAANVPVPGSLALLLLGLAGLMMSGRRPVLA